MTLWKHLQIISGKTVEQCAKELGIAKSTLYLYLSCRKPVPYYVQVYFLKLRGFDIDLINARYIEERIEENARHEGSKEKN